MLKIDKMSEAKTNVCTEMVFVFISQCYTNDSCCLCVCKSVCLNLCVYNYPCNTRVIILSASVCVCVCEYFIVFIKPHVTAR